MPQAAIPIAAGAASAGAATAATAATAGAATAAAGTVGAGMAGALGAGSGALGAGLTGAGTTGLASTIVPAGSSVLTSGAPVVAGATEIAPVVGGASEIAAGEVAANSLMVPETLQAGVVEMGGESAAELAASEVMGGMGKAGSGVVPGPGPIDPSMGQTASYAMNNAPEMGQAFKQGAGDYMGNLMDFSDTSMQGMMDKGNQFAGLMGNDGNAQAEQQAQMQAQQMQAQQAQQQEQQRLQQQQMMEEQQRIQQQQIQGLM